MSVVGKPVPHESAAKHVTGSALYTDDLTGHFAGVLHAWPVQAQVAHGSVKSIDTTRASNATGVVRILTGDDVRGTGNIGPARLDEPLFPTEVVHHGQPVAWVLATSVESAIAAAQQVRVDVEELPALLSVEDAEAADSFHTPLLTIENGDPDTAIEAAPHRLRGTLHIGGQEHFYLETQTAIATRDEEGGFLVHSSTQHPTETQEIVARVLGVSKNEVVCQSLRMGGAFGGKEVQANLWAAVAALGCQITGRPVSVRLDRLRDFTMTGKRHPFLARYEVGYDDEGTILGVNVGLISDGGFSLDLSKPVVQRAMFHIDNCYRFDNVRVTGRVAKTHKVSQTAFRGFGGPQGMVAIEEVMAQVALRLGMDAAQVRKKNMYEEGDHTHYGQKVRDAGRVREIWDALEKSSDLQQRRQEVDAFNAAHPSLKRGMAITPVKFGISFTADWYNQGGALVLIYKDGSVHVNHGGTEMGQGLHTKMRQVAARGLGVPLENVRIMPTRTDKVPNTSATAASAGTDLNGAAVANACEKLIKRLRVVAADMLSCEASDVEFADGAVSVRGDAHEGSATTFENVVTRAYFDRVQLFADGFYKTPGIGFDEEKGRGTPFYYFAYGAAVTEVEIDRYTGQYRFLRADILHDVGDSISPLVDRGQVEGGYAQGVGWLTQEELVWDSAGVLKTSNASTYKLPSLGECPEVFNVELMPKATEPNVIHGSKAVGEPPFMLAISAREALRDAIGAFARGVPFELGCPSTAEACYWAIEQVLSPHGSR